jgi:hypothetical protein
LYRTTGSWLGLPTGRVNHSLMFRCRWSLAGSGSHTARPFFERFVQLRLGKGRIGTEDCLLAQAPVGV